MTKQTYKGKAKIAQQYQPNPNQPECRNCVHYKSEMERHNGFFNSYTLEKSKVCGIGGFAVKKTGTCLKHEFDPEKLK